MIRYLPVSVSKRWPTLVRPSFVLASLYCTDLAPDRFEDNGRAHSFNYSMRTGPWNGWVGTETVLVRLNNSYAPKAKFPVWSADPIEDASGFSSRIGYDAAICVKIYGPWIVQIYNSSLGIPTTMTIVGKSATTDFEADYGNKGPPLDAYTRALNSTDKGLTFFMRYAGGFSFEHY